MSKMREILAAVSAYKLEDADRQAQYKQLLKELNAIVVGKDFDEIWEDVKALAEFQQKLDAISDLIETENVEFEEMWTPEQCLKWLIQAGFDDPERCLKEDFSFYDHYIDVEGLDLRGKKNVTELPWGIRRIRKSLMLSGSGVQRLPSSLEIVGGDLDLKGTKVKVLPTGLTHITGSVYLQDTEIEELPVGLDYIGGHLNLEGTKVKKLPAGLTRVMGDLNLCGTDILKFPDRLGLVGGNLSLQQSKVTELPVGLIVVKGYLDLRDSSVVEVSGDLVVEKDVYLHGCSRKLIKKFKKMKKEGKIKGNIFV